MLICMEHRTDIAAPDARENDLVRVAFGEVLARRRTEAGYDQRPFARDAGISNSHLRKIEQGKTSPTLITVHRIASTLNMDASSLIVEMDDRIRAKKRERAFEA